jgi:hypothetical protein
MGVRQNGWYAKKPAPVLARRWWPGDNGDGGDGSIKWDDGHFLGTDRQDDLLRPIYENGIFLNIETFATVRQRLAEQAGRCQGTAPEAAAV